MFYWQILKITQKYPCLPILIWKIAKLNLLLVLSKAIKSFVYRCKHGEGSL